MNNIVTKSGKMLFTLSECKAYIDKLEKEKPNTGTSKWIESKDNPVCLCKKCRGWGFISFKFCPHCGRTMESKED